MGVNWKTQLADASTLDKEADKLKKRDPGAAAGIQRAANKKRRAAVKQLTRKRVTPTRVPLR